MTKVCTDCGHMGEPVAQGLSSFGVDAFVWMFFTGVFLVTFLLPVMLIPAAWTIYHLFTYFSVTCKACGNFSMVALDSSDGAKSMRQYHTDQAIHSTVYSTGYGQNSQEAA